MMYVAKWNTGAWLMVVSKKATFLVLLAVFNTYILCESTVNVVKEYLSTR
jgi:hypothetical protein